MLKTLALTAIVVAAGIAAVLALAAAKPDTFQVARATNIKAPPQKIFPLINELRAWQPWSPYEKKDPAMKRTYSGPASGSGATYEWEGNANVGSGRVQIAESSPPSKVTIKLDMLKPFEAHNIVEFKLEPRGDATTVTWAMQGRTPFFAKIVHLFLDMDRMVGSDFEAGLANLKAIAER